jgi:superfamily II DNA or RNA helicase
VVESISTLKAQDLGLISPFKIYNVPVRLTTDEQIEYDKADKSFNGLFSFFNKDLKTMFACMNTNVYSNFLAKKGMILDSSVASYPFMCNAAMAKRKNIIYNSESKIKAVKKLSNIFSEKKAIIFSQTIEFADKVTDQLDNCVSFHSKISKKKRNENLNLLKSGNSITRISTAKALNEGMNVPDISMAIIASGTSKTKDMIQRIGRAVRWEADKEASIFRLYIQDSQEEKWVNSSQEKYEVEQLKL